MKPDFSFEQKFIRRGYNTIFGVDEVGVGPIAGMVTAAAVTMPAKIKNTIPGLKDSKKLTPRKRDEFYKFFLSNLKIDYALASVSEKIIDRINILEARKLASKRAILKLEKKIGNRADVIIVDGKTYINIDREQVIIIKGDEKIAVCAIASIIAKVTRDKMMIRYHRKYPQYRFDLHKGYGTKLHYEMLLKYGPSLIHRKSFNLRENV